MSILSRYLARTALSGTLLVLLILVAMSTFFNMLGEISDLGKGTYDLQDAVYFVLLSIPQQAYQLFPIAVLLGGLLGLGQLAAANELMVMRTAGVSLYRLAAAVLLGGVMLAVACVALGEFLAPPAERLAKELKIRETQNRVGVASAQGIWLRQGNTFANIRVLTKAGDLRDIHLFTLDEEGRVARAAQATHAGRHDGGWQLHDYQATEFAADGLTTQNAATRTWPITLDSDMFELFVVDTDTLSSLDLYRYIQYLHANELAASAYELAFWMRVITPVAVIVMLVLALPFVFGPLRSVGVGQRLVFGILIGVVFYIVNQTLTSSGQVYALPPLLVAWTPTVLLAGITLYALRRTN